MALRELLLPRLAQPQEVVDADQESLTQGLVRAYVPLGGLGPPPTVQSAPIAAGPLGVAREGNSSGWIEWPAATSKLGGDYTIIAIAETAVADYTEQFLYCEGVAYATSGNQLQVYRASGEGRFYINGRNIPFSDVPASTPVLIGSTVRSGVTNGSFDFAALRGRLSKTAAYTRTAVGGSLGSFVGKNVGASTDAVSFNATTKVYAVYTWARALSEAEILSLSADHWQVFAPQRIWVPVSAAGATTYTLSAPTYVPGSITSTGLTARVTVTAA